jgi:hypothetical protein
MVTLSEEVIARRAARNARMSEAVLRIEVAE